MTSVGDILRTARESQGRAVSEVAAELCITQRYLRAIEQNNLEEIPGTFFYKSFVRQYAAIVGVDLKVLRPALDAMVPPEETEPRPVAAPTSHASRDLRPPVRALDPLVEDTNRRYFSSPRLGWSVTGLFLVLVICSGFYAWWNRPAETASSSVSLPLPPQVQEAAVVTITQEAPQAENSTDELEGVVLKLSATERTWLSITSDGKQVFSGVLEPSQSKTLRGLDIATMKVGNAGGIDVHWNGKSIGPLGPHGQVMTFRFTPVDFKVIPPNETL